MMMRLVVFCLMIMILTGCVGDKPRPKGMVEIVPLQMTNVSKDVVEVISQQQNHSLSVKHHVHEHDVYVECFIPNFFFKEKGGSKINGEGHVTVYIDGKKVNDMYTTAFIVRGLEKGIHEMIVEVVHNDSTSYNLKKTWDVTIQ
jgi:hypothetical protein